MQPQHVVVPRQYIEKVQCAILLAALSGTRKLPTKQRPVPRSACGNVNASSCAGSQGSSGSAMASLGEEEPVTYGSGVR